MAEKKVRVHNLAKELEVESKTILEKCRAEGIGLKGHMDVVSAGLQATIREWFSEGAHSTAVEESSRVNLETARKKPKRIVQKPVEETAVVTAPPAEEVPAAAETELDAVDDEDDETLAAKAPSLVSADSAVSEETEEAPVTSPVVEVAEADDNDLALPSVDESVKKVAAIAPPTAPPAATTPPGKPAPPKTVVGPQNIPRPAQLSGPKLVRMEKPDPVAPPRPSVRGPVRPLSSPGLIPMRGGELDEEGRRGRGGARGVPPRGRVVGKVPAVDDKAVPAKRTLKDERDEVAEKLKEWRDRDLIERRDRLAHASGRGIGGLRAIEGKQSARRPGQRKVAPTPARKDKVQLTEPIQVKDLSREAGIPAAEIIKKLMEETGDLATINSVVSADTAQLIAVEHGIELEVVAAKTGLDKLQEEFAALPRKHIVTRPPVVTVLGHVDHGKTSLLDRIRKANVAKGEAGGITQHIGAYRVKVGDRWVTFLDTPGHTAFTAMRARGTNMTDVVVLVVAADDGVMPTTIEAINHAKAANSTIVVALNKIDLPHDLNKIYGQLSEHGLTPSGDWGGETDVVPTSATTGQGIEDLLAHLATLSDVMDLKADDSIPATGTVIEAHRSESLGNVAHLLVQEGTLKPGDIIVCGSGQGRVRALRDDRAKSLKNAGPSTPVEVTGLSDVPMAGDKFFVVNSSQRAKEIADEVASLRRAAELSQLTKPNNLESMLASRTEGEIPVLRVILRADMQGSVDVLKKALSEYPEDQVKLDILHTGVGTVTESDVVLAQASEAIIIAFHVAPDSAVKRMADNIGVDIREYRIIYNVIDDIRKALEGLLTPDEKIESRGRAEVREVFNISKVGKIAGSFVRDGIINRAHLVRVVRDGVIVKDMIKIDTLKRVKDDAKEVKAGLECGIRLANFDDLKPGDVIEALEVTKIARKLDRDAKRASV